MVTGTVSEEDGTPLTGAVRPGRRHEQCRHGSAIDGLYTLKNVPSGAVLRVSFLGYDPVEKKVDADRMDFILKASAQEIASVSDRYAKMDKRIFTGATDQLLASDVKLDGISEISRGLEGRSAGVSVQNVSGTFGAAPKIRIRGATSIFETPSRCGWTV